MKPLLLFSVVALVSEFAAFPVFGSETGPWSLTSPDGMLSVIVTRTQPAVPGSDKAGRSYRVQRAGKDVLPDSPLGIQLQRLGAFQNDLRYVGESRRTVDERYAMPVGKRGQCRNHAQELTIDLANATNGQLSLIVRAYDDGIAYCYRIHGTGRDTVVGESSGFVIPPGSHGWLSRYTTYYESDYDVRENLAGIDYDLAMPALFRTPNAHWVLVSPLSLSRITAPNHPKSM